jgi:hypothetical protein
LQVAKGEAGKLLSEFFVICLLLIAAAAGYLLPAIVAFYRGHEYRWVILMLTIAGGWTGVLWVLALVWSAFPHNRALIDPVAGPATGVGEVGG